MKKRKDLESKMWLPAKEHENSKEESDTQTEQDRTTSSQKPRISALEPAGTQLNGQSGHTHTKQGKRDGHRCKMVPHQY